VALDNGLPADPARHTAVRAGVARQRKARVAIVPASGFDQKTRRDPLERIMD